MPCIMSPMLSPHAVLWEAAHEAYVKPKKANIMTDYTLLIVAVLFGLALGSFFGCTSYRIAHEWSLFKPSGSHCPSCGKKLGFKENIPVLSYFIQKGKCRGCDAKLSLLYPLAELSYGLWSGLVFWQYGLSVEYGVFMVIGALLLLIALVDLEAYFIPDLFITIGVLVTAGASLFGIGVPMPDAAYGALLGAAIMQALRLAYMRVRKEEGMGYGDVKLLFFLGLCSGLLGLAYVLLMAAVLAIICTIIGQWGAVKSTTRTPFGPYLCAACAIYMFCGDAILRLFGYTQ